MAYEQLVARCLQQDSLAQKELYDTFAPRLLGVCRRYVTSIADAEDVLLEAMYKVLTKLHLYKADGSLEGWMRRIVVNEALMFLRKQHQSFMVAMEQLPELPQAPTYPEEHQEVYRLLDKLPIGYRTVFNLFVLENYSHQEIADLLGISVSTSKSQLFLAKQRLHTLLTKTSLS